MRADITVCVPVLRRYDLLAEMIDSLQAGSVQPARVWIIDNGQQPRRLNLSRYVGYAFEVDAFVPIVRMGVAESWNWFIDHTDGWRIITNDDVSFGNDSLARLTSEHGGCVGAVPGRAFSCFLLRDACVASVGRFDETLSPGYAYFEDCDYEARMRAAGVDLRHVDCGLSHPPSQTLAVATPAELADHHRRFMIARANYLRKWGSLPEGVA